MGDLAGVRSEERKQKGERERERGVPHMLNDQVLTVYWPSSWKKSPQRRPLAPSHYLSSKQTYNLDLIC